MLTNQGDVLYYCKSKNTQNYPFSFLHISPAQGMGGASVFLWEDGIHIEQIRGTRALLHTEHRGSEPRGDRRAAGRAACGLSEAAQAIVSDQSGLRSAADRRRVCHHPGGKRLSHSERGDDAERNGGLSLAGFCRAEHGKLRGADGTCGI